MITRGGMGDIGRRAAVRVLPVRGPDPTPMPTRPRTRSARHRTRVRPASCCYRGDTSGWRDYRSCYRCQRHRELGCSRGRHRADAALRSAAGRPRSRSPTPVPVPEPEPVADPVEPPSRTGMARSPGASRWSARSSGCARSGWTSPGCCCRCSPTRPGTTAPTPRAARRRPVSGARTDHPWRRAECECGFYAYGTERGRRAQPAHALRPGGRLVLGQCRRRHAGRARRARAHRRAVARTGRAARRCAPGSRRPTRARGLHRPAAMLAEHPLSALPCYEPPPRPACVAARRRRCSARPAAPSACCRRVADRAGLASGWRRSSRPRRWCCGCWSARTAPGIWPRRRSPRACWPGWSRRCSAWPAGCCGCRCCAASLVAGGGYLLSLRPGYFPVVTHARASRAFCGVRP